MNHMIAMIQRLHRFVTTCQVVSSPQFAFEITCMCPTVANTDTDTFRVNIWEHGPLVQFHHLLGPDTTNPSSMQKYIKTGHIPD